MCGGMNPKETTCPGIQNFHELTQSCHACSRYFPSATCVRAASACRGDNQSATEFSHAGAGGRETTYLRRVQRVGERL